MSLLGSIKAASLALGIVFLPQAGSVEVVFLDLTGVVARTELRYPPPPPPKCDGGEHCVSGGSGGGSVSDCGVGGGEPRALRITLVRLDQEAGRRGERLGYEVLVENVGTVPLSIPISPHLADLQPPDPTQSFSFEEIDVGIQLTGDNAVPLSGIAYLYSAADRPDTVVEVRPGQSFRVRSKLLLEPTFFKEHAAQDISLKALPYLVLRSGTHRAQPGSSFRELRNKCPRVERVSTQAFTLLASPAVSN